MVMKAIDKSSSPLWVRILVWILVAGLLAATVVGIAGLAIQGWVQEPQPMVITADDLPPEFLQQLEEAQMAEQEAAENAGVDDGETEQGDTATPDVDEEGTQSE